MEFTPEELAAMRAADAEIEQEFEAALSEGFIQDLLDCEVDKWIDELAVLDLMDKKERHKFQYQRRYREANKEQIAEAQRRYREENREAYNAYMREYMREYKKGKRRKEKVACGNIKNAV